MQRDSIRLDVAGHGRQRGLQRSKIKSKELDTLIFFVDG